MRVVINGRFLSQMTTGVHRVAIEITRELDKIAKEGEIVLGIPQNTEIPFELHNIKIEIIGKHQGYMWVQWELLTYSLKERRDILTFSGLSSFLRPGFCYAHDINHYRFPESYNTMYRTIYDLYFRYILKYAKRVITVSKFSKSELCSVYGLEERKISVVYNACSCVTKKYDENVIKKYGLTKYEYFLTVGSVNCHKNQKFVQILSDKHNNKYFVVAGGMNKKEFKKVDIIDSQNIKHIGYVSDIELYNLYHYAKGFIFPSLYEGFGIPPLEAILNGCKNVAISNIDVHREIYCKGVYFFDPRTPNTFSFDDFLKVKVCSEDVEHYRHIFSWGESAKKIYDVMS